MYNDENFNSIYNAERKGCKVISEIDVKMLEIIIASLPYKLTAIVEQRGGHMENLSIKSKIAYHSLICLNK